MSKLIETVKIDTDLARFNRMRSSVRGAVGHIRRDVENFRIGRPLMLTLTYRDVDGWEPSHITDYLRSLSLWLRRRGEKLRYTWVAELQSRGAVHYHVLVWAKARIPRPDKPARKGYPPMWPHGMSKTERLRSGGVSYITKYLTKKDQFKKFPRGIRIYGYGGLTAKSRYDMRWFRLPRYVREFFSYNSDVIRAVGGGFFARSTGERLDSPYQFAGFGDRCVYIQKVYEV